MVLAVVLVLLAAAAAMAEGCYVARLCVAVKQPALMVRVCDLAAQARLDSPLREFHQVLSAELHKELPDDARAAFEEMVEQRDFVVLEEGTPLFDCQYSLEQVRQTPDGTASVDISLPMFNCNGVAYSLVPVRPLGFQQCYWIALESLACDDDSLPRVPEP